MRQYLFYPLLVIITSCFFTGCDKTNDEGPVIFEEFNPFNITYTTDDEGCTLKGAPIYTKEEIMKEIVGYGWKVISTYEVQSNGRLAHDDFWKGMIGIGPTDYWFISESQIVSFFRHSDTGNKYAKAEWTYDLNRGFIWRTDQAQTSYDKERYMQIIRISTSGDKTSLYAIQQIASQSVNGEIKPVFGMVIYQRMSDHELAETKANADYNADKDSNMAVPNSCKFRLKASYSMDNFNEETSGRVILTFRSVNFVLTDAIGTTILPNPATEYFDSIVWRSDSKQMPDSYCIHRHGTGSSQTNIKWDTYFFDKDPNLTTYLDGYKDGQVVYSYVMQHNIYPEKFLCYDWSSFSISKPREYTAFSVLNNKRCFTVYEPRIYDNDMSKIYAELRYISEPNDDINSLQKEADELTALMNNLYSNGTPINGQTDFYSNLFKALPERADIRTYWETEDTRIVLVLSSDEKESQNKYYYIHAEPK